MWGERMCSGFEITVRGRSGHASIPDLADNPVPKLAPVIDRIERMARPTRDLPELQAFLRAIGEEGADPVEVARAGRAGRLAGRCRADPADAGSGDHADRARGVGQPERHPRPRPPEVRLPDLARAEAGGDPQRRRGGARRGSTTSFAFLEEEGGTASPSRVAAVGRDRCASSAPSSRARSLVPTISTGFTDSHFLREALRLRRLRVLAASRRPDRPPPPSSTPPTSGSSKDDLARRRVLHAGRAGHRSRSDERAAGRHRAGRNGASKRHHGAQRAATGRRPCATTRAQVHVASGAQAAAAGGGRPGRRCFAASPGWPEMVYLIPTGPQPTAPGPPAHGGAGHGLGARRQRPPSPPPRRARALPRLVAESVAATVFPYGRPWRPSADRSWPATTAPSTR